MSSLTIKNLGKVYDGKVEVLTNVNIEVQHGEFVVLVGPSGCGKSTLLRTIAGLEEATSGDVIIGERRVNELPPAERDIAMVFQDYALYPHMTVRENLSFGLRIRKEKQDAIDSRVKSASTMLGIEHLLDRKPSQLSGGQRQRVAIGRAIVREPGIYLFDEPLSNLDAKLRAQTRIELAALHKNVGNTVVYVTHDQVEAMTLATKIVILSKGIVQQVGAPLDVYHKPINKFVASFIGSPGMNFLDGELKFENGKKLFHTTFGEVIDFSDAPTPKAAGKMTLGLRPESIKVLARSGRESEGKADLKLVVTLLEPHGHESHLVVKLGNEQGIVRSANPKRLEVMGSAKPGDVLPATVERSELHWFAPDADGQRLQAI